MEFCPDNNCGDMAKVFICCPYSKQAGSACPIADSCVGQDVACSCLWQCCLHRNALNQEMGYDLFLCNTKPLGVHKICVCACVCVHSCVTQMKSNEMLLCFSTGNPGASKPRWGLYYSTRGWSVSVYHR